MTQLRVTNINDNEHFLSLTQQMQKQIKGGFNQEIYALLTSTDNEQVDYGYTDNGAFEYNIFVDNGENNLINQGAV